jgi:hypothetical protein
MLYGDVIARRYQAATGNPAVLVETSETLDELAIRDAKSTRKATLTHLREPATRRHSLCGCHRVRQRRNRFSASDKTAFATTPIRPRSITPAKTSAER